MPYPRTRDAAKNILLFLASVTFTLSVLEIGARLSGMRLDFANHQRRYDRVLGWTATPDAGTYDAVNDAGFRYHEVEREKPPGVRRLVVLGDSFAFAAAVPYAGSFPGRLETWLNESRQSERWEVLNLAVGDWGNTQQSIALEEHGLAYHPDVVVLQIFPFNDLCNNSLALANTCSMLDPYRPYLAPGPDGLRRVYLSSWRFRLRRFSTFFRLMEGRLLARARTQGTNRKEAEKHFFAVNKERAGLSVNGALSSLLEESDQPPAVRQAWKTMEGVITGIHDMLQAQEIPLVAVVIPYAHTMGVYWESYRHRTTTKLVADSATRRVEQILASLMVPTLSVRSRIEASGLDPDKYFLLPKDSHLSGYGHYRVAAWIAEELSRQQLVDESILEVAVARAGQVYDLLADVVTVPVTGLSRVTVNKENGRRSRFGLGPETTVTFVGVREPATWDLRFEIYNLFPGQEVTVEVNGQRKIVVKDLDRRGVRASRRLRFEAARGRNFVRFSYKLWNRAENVIAPRDSRPIAVNFIKLEILRPAQ